LLRQSRLLCRLLDGFALQIKMKDRESVDFRQAVEFLVQEGLQVTPLSLRGCFGFGHLRHLLLSPPPLRSHGFRFHGGAESNAVQPVGESLPRPDGRCFASEDKKGRLKSVLGVVVVGDNTTKDAEAHGAVTTDRAFKGRFALLLDEGPQQSPILPPSPILPQHGSAKMPKHRVYLSSRHTCPPRPVASDLYHSLPGQSQV